MSCCCQRQNDDRIIAGLARQIHELAAKVEMLEEGERKTRRWTDQAKRDAGFSEYVTFDDVWAKALAAYKETPEFRKSKESK